MIDVFFAELIGTFMFLAVIIISGHATLKYDTMGWLKIGSPLSVAILVFSKISACFNPAVSFMLYLNKDISAVQMCVGIFGQIIGAVLAYFYYRYLKKNYSSLL